MNFISKKSGAFWGVLSIVALGALAGCGYSGTDLCDDSCDCSGCPELEHTICLDLAEDEEKEADYQNCSAQYSDYYGCVGSEFQCVQSVAIATGCGHEKDSYDNCRKH